MYFQVQILRSQDLSQIWLCVRSSHFWSLFVLLVSQARAARQLLERIQSHGIDARLEALKELAKLSADPTFAAEFINMEGIGTLARLVESGTQWVDRLHVSVPVPQHVSYPVNHPAEVKVPLVFPCSFGEMLAFTLTAFLELMDHGIVSWDLISLSFIKQVTPLSTGLFY